MLSEVTRKVIKKAKVLGKSQINHVENESTTYTGCPKECARLWEGVPYVKVYRYNTKHLCPKLNGYGDNGQRTLKL
jgi:hypothetical protein